MVLLAYFVLLGAGAVLLLPRYLGLFFCWIGILVVLLIVICLLKGEKPRWRWGKD